MGAATRRLDLVHPRGKCDVSVGVGVLETEFESLCRWVENRRVFLVTTPVVEALYLEDLQPLLDAAGSYDLFRVPDGESAKSLEVAGQLWQWLLQSGGKRDSRLITLGGGSVGDLGGFVAGCFLRGIEYVQMPTTLLAQVDASIGGKTAIDLAEAKNSVGLFHHPARVVSDTRWLASLPAEELRSGLFEVIKMAFLLDPELLERVERDLEDLLDFRAEAWVPVVAAAAAAKIDVVQQDPEEAHLRKLLNFGHTLAHALETSLGYSGLRHGEAVGWGMLLALKLSETRGLDEGASRRLQQLISRIGIPALPELSVETLIDLMRRDKKAREGGISWVLAEALGAGIIVSDVRTEEVMVHLSALLAADSV